MSGLVKLVKKVFKPINDLRKKVMKSKIFKAIVIGAAVIFTGGAALGAIGAGGGFLSSIGAAFQGGLAALGNVGRALWSGVQAVGTMAGNAVRAIVPGGATTSGATATGIAGTTQGASMQFLSGAATETAKAGILSSPLAQAAAVQTVGNMVSGYAQGRAGEEAYKQQERDNLRKDRYGIDGYGNKNGLMDPTDRLDAINNSARAGASLDQAPSVRIARPIVNSPSKDLETAMRNKLMVSLDGLSPVGA